MRIVITISPRRFTQVLLLVMLSLTFASIAGGLFNYISIDDYFLIEMRESFIRLFRLDGEANIPTWYSSSLLLLCSSLLATITLAKKRNDDCYVLHWGGLAIIFLYLSLDEAAMIHEMAVKPLRSIFNTSGFLYYPWVIPAAVSVFIFVLVYLRFVTNLAAKTRRLFLIAGIIFVTGAIGVESISGWYAYSFGDENLTYKIITTVEEFFEMLGIVVFIYALLEYMGSFLIELRFSSMRQLANFSGQIPPSHSLPWCARAQRQAPAASADAALPPLRP